MLLWLGKTLAIFASFMVVIYVLDEWRNPHPEYGIKQRIIFAICYLVAAGILAY